MTATKKLTAAIFAASLCAAGAASAATFSFTGSNLSDASSRSYTVDGITVTVTAGTFSTWSNPSSINFGSRLVDVDPNGLGADAGGDGDLVDGSNGNDVLVFTFDRDVTIDSISFGDVGSNDDFAFGTVTGTAFTRIVNFQDVASSVSTSTFGGDVVGLAFGIGAIGSNDEFTVSGLTVSEVPLPAAGWMLLAGMGGLAAMKRRKKA
jgi:hypothetical protein